MDFMRKVFKYRTLAFLVFSAKVDYDLSVQWALMTMTINLQQVPMSFR